tara:strand:- start:133 stop:498 length:366 start_codon:yes stop_codon:yes gene_type:complete
MDSLSSISIPSTVTTIGTMVFHSDHALTTIHLPDTIEHIGKDAFDDCTGLTTVTVGETLIQGTATEVVANMLELLDERAHEDPHSLKAAFIVLDEDGNDITEERRAEAAARAAAEARANEL